MAEENFTINLLRLVSAQQMLSLGLQAAREMYGKSYFALGVAEKVALDQTVNQMIAANYQNLTPAYLAAQTPKSPVGFQVPTAATKPDTNP
jgi:hypothetical protein